MTMSYVTGVPAALFVTRSRSDAPAPTDQPAASGRVMAKNPPGATATVCVAAPNGPTNCVAAAAPTTQLLVLAAYAATAMSLTLTNVSTAPNASISVPARSMSSVPDGAMVRVSLNTLSAWLAPVPESRENPRVNCSADACDCRSSPPRRVVSTERLTEVPDRGIVGLLDARLGDVGLDLDDVDEAAFCLLLGRGVVALPRADAADAGAAGQAGLADEQVADPLPDLLGDQVCVPDLVEVPRVWGALDA